MLSCCLSKAAIVAIVGQQRSSVIRHLPRPVVPEPQRVWIHRRHGLPLRRRCTGDCAPLGYACTEGATLHPHWCVPSGISYTSARFAREASPIILSSWCLTVGHDPQPVPVTLNSTSANAHLPPVHITHCPVVVVICERASQTADVEPDASCSAKAGSCCTNGHKYWKIA